MDVQRLLFILDAVNLKADESGGRDRIFQVCGGNTVQPRFDGIAPAFDAELVPRILLERLTRRLVLLQIDQPAAAAFVVDAACPGTGGRVDFYLVAVNPASRDFVTLAVQLDRPWLVKTLTANLHA